MSDKLDAVLADVAQATYQIGERQIVLEEMCAFKVAQVLKVLSKFAEDVQLKDVIETLALTQGNVNLVAAATTFLPRLLHIAPDALIQLLALAVIPNAELETLSDAPGAIEKRIASEAKFFNFRANAAQVAELASLCVPLMGLDALKKAVPALGQRVMESLGLQLQTPSEN